MTKFEGGLEIKNLNSVEAIEAEIKLLQSKLELHKKLENYKTPCQEAFKRVYGYYSTTNASDTTWIDFVNGYKSAQEDYRVGEYQEPEEEPEQLKTLYQMLYDRVWIEPCCDEFCNIVKEWMSQYTHNVMSGEYLRGYEDCMLVLEENLK